jgi:hypothetical protein
MTQALQSTVGSAPTTGAQPTAQIGAPNQYHLHGGGIHVSYFPGGTGPVLDYFDPKNPVTWVEVVATGGSASLAGESATQLGRQPPVPQPSATRRSTLWARTP